MSDNKAAGSIGLAMFSFTHYPIDISDKDEYVLIRKNEENAQVALLPSYDINGNIRVSLASLEDPTEASIFIYNIMLDDVVNLQTIKDNSLMRVLSIMESTYKVMASKNEYMFTRCDDLISKISESFNSQQFEDITKDILHVNVFTYEKELTRQSLLEEINDEKIVDKIIDLFDIIYAEGDIYYE